MGRLTGLDTGLRGINRVIYENAIRPHRWVSNLGRGILVTAIANPQVVSCPLLVAKTSGCLGNDH